MKRMFLYFEQIKLDLVLLVLCSFVSCKEKEPLLKGTYDHYIGYLNPETTSASTGFCLCDRMEIEGIHSPKIEYSYKPNKGVFKKNIRSKFDRKTYSDNGYVNYRFVVNCYGDTGYFEIIQMNLDLEKTELNQDLVQQLHTLTASSVNWKAFRKANRGFNYYMYVSYKIQNGEIAEILP